MCARVYVYENVNPLCLLSWPCCFSSLRESPLFSMLLLDQSLADCISNKSRIHTLGPACWKEIGRNYSSVKNLPSGPFVCVDRYVAFESERLRITSLVRSLVMQRHDIATDAVARRETTEGKGKERRKLARCDGVYRLINSFLIILDN